jgi:hypothetical protein
VRPSLFISTVPNVGEKAAALGCPKALGCHCLILSENFDLKIAGYGW